MFAQVAKRAVMPTRNFSTSVIRRGGDGLPPPGDNLPFSINNRYNSHFFPSALLPQRNSVFYFCLDYTLPYKNLHFICSHNYIFLFRYKLTAYFIMFFGSGLSIPFLAMRHQLLKK